MSTDLKEKTKDFIKSHPPMSHKKFAAISGIKISDCYYYTLRNEIFPRGKRKSGTYINLITVPSKGLSSEAEETIANILKAINVVQRTRLEILKNLQTKSLEIRRIGI